MIRCECCGKFRKNKDVVVIDYADGYGDYAEQAECKNCMSLSDKERYFKYKVWDNAECAFMRLVERVHPDMLDQNQKELIKQLKQKIEEY